ncbi:MAG TPA: glycosyltransferase family 39 protein [Polyangiaceae bacterium]|nr:glycosyltransferase family 39 protein [Polyangiaceae bacterium]
MRRNWLISLASLLAVGALIGGIRAGALWDPHEVTVAELARRLALNLLGGVGLAIPGADNSVPIRADLGRGELPFTSAALGFRLLGLSDWAGRLPLALWAVVGVASIYAAAARLWNSRVALYASLVLATTPLYFLQARVLLGDAVTMATFAMAWSGLAVACLGSGVSARARVAFALWGAVGLYAGFWCRGPIVNVAVPALAVSVAALSRRSAPGSWRGLSLAVGVVGLLAFALGCQGLALAAQTGEYSVFVGSSLRASPELTTFEAALGELAHAAFPWSGAAPLVLALLLRPSDADAPGSAAVNAAALALGLSLAVSAWLSADLGYLVPPAVACFAVLVAAALGEIEAGRLGSPLLGLAVAALVAVIGLDLRAFPDKTLVGFALADVTLPDTLHEASGSLWLAGAAALAACAALVLYEPQPTATADAVEAPRRFDFAEYRRLLETLQKLWNGNLVFALLVLEAALVGFLLLSAISERLVALPQLESFGSVSRRLVAMAAICVPLSPLLPLGAMLLRDVSRMLFAERAGKWRALSMSRAQGLTLIFAALGGIASLGFYPALARQVSPQEALETYRGLRRGAEPLGMIGERMEAARYQGAPHATSFDDVEPAFEWLTQAGAQRRWLVLREGDLPELNARYRALHHSNLPVLDARSSQVLLASSRRAPGERDQSPLAALVLDTPPKVQHPLHAVLGDKLEVLGWSVNAADGSAQSSVVPGTVFRFSIFLRVLAPITGPWKTFVHIDGLQRRFNADHDPLDGKYPLRLWRQGDVMVDTTEVTLEPNFSPGPYRVYFGLFAGDHRLPVTDGPANDDRIVAGTLQVR